MMETRLITGATD